MSYLFPFAMTGQTFVDLESAVTEGEGNLMVFIGFGTGIILWFKLDPLVLELVLSGGAKHAMVDDLVCVLSEYLVCEGIPDVVCHTDPPSWFFLGRREGGV
jgi:hypothetical protein